MIVKEREPTKHLFAYQQKLVEALIENSKKHIVVLGCGLGKGPSSVVWADCKRKLVHKDKVLVITTSSKTHVKDELKRNDFEQDADAFAPGLRDEVLFETVSWDSLYKWVTAHKGELGEWIYIADEIFKGKNPLSRRGKAFQAIAKATDNWTGYTATPGQVWIDFLGYFIAAGFVRNKTQFMRQFCNVQTFKGFPEIVGYHNEDTLKRWWEQISYAPDAREAIKELPKANYDLVYVSKPKGYSKVLKMRQKLCSDGELSEKYEDMLDNCFFGNTLVMTPNGEKRIDAVKNGDSVFAYDLERGKIMCAKVEELVKRKAPTKMMKITLADGRTIVSTLDHRHYTNCGYKEAREIKNGDYLYKMPYLRERCKNSSNAIQQAEAIQRKRQSLLFERLHNCLCKSKTSSANNKKDGRKIRERDGLQELRESASNERHFPQRLSEPYDGRNALLLKKLCRTSEKKGGFEALQKKTGRRIWGLHSMWNMRTPNTDRKNRTRRHAENKRWGARILFQEMFERSGIQKREHLLPTAQNGDKKRLKSNGRNRRFSTKVFYPSNNIAKRTRKNGSKRMGTRIFNSSKKKMGERIQGGVFGRFSQPKEKNICRVRREKSQADKTKSPGRKEKSQISRVRVERVEVLERRDHGKYCGDSDENFVYCLKTPPYCNFFVEGILTHNCSALTNYLRRLCWSEKKQWVSDYLEGLGTNCVIFYNYIDTGNELEEIAHKVLPKEAKVWRIDGSHHEIPTADTIGEYDVVLAQWQSGGEGLNLQMTTQMVMVEPTYSYVIWHQAKKRIHRIGQDKPVFYHALFARGTIEEDILKCIREKRDFAENTWLISNKLVMGEV